MCDVCGIDDGREKACINKRESPLLFSFVVLLKMIITSAAYF